MHCMQCFPMLQNSPLQNNWKALNSRPLCSKRGSVQFATNFGKDLYFKEKLTLKITWNPTNLVPIFDQVVDLPVPHLPELVVALAAAVGKSDHGVNLVAVGYFDFEALIAVLAAG